MKARRPIPETGWRHDAYAPAVLAVRPPFAAMLVDGGKTVEVRRRVGVDLVGPFVAVYETAPVSAAIGVIRFDSATRAEPRGLWRIRAVATGCAMTRRQFDAYAAGAATVTALFVEAAKRMPPVALADLRQAGFRPPRSWRLLEWPERELLEKQWGFR